MVVTLMTLFVLWCTRTLLWRGPETLTPAHMICATPYIVFLVVMSQKKKRYKE